MLDSLFRVRGNRVSHPGQVLKHLRYKISVQTTS